MSQMEVVTKAMNGNIRGLWIQSQRLFFSCVVYRYCCPRRILIFCGMKQLRLTIGLCDPLLAMLFMVYSGFLFGHDANYRDVCVLGNCDDIIMKFAKMLNMKKELQNMISNYRKPDLQTLYSP